MDKDVYTIKEVASMFRISEQTVRRLIKNNQIPHYKVGNQYRFNKWDLREYSKGSLCDA